MATSAKAALLDEMILDARQRASAMKNSLELEEKYLLDLVNRRQALESEEAAHNGQEESMEPAGAEAETTPLENRNISGRTVPDAIKAVLENRGRAMRARDITAALLAAGFKTESKNGLLPSVLSALGRRDDLFKKIRRGTYKLVTPA